MIDWLVGIGVMITCLILLWCFREIVINLVQEKDLIRLLPLDEKQDIASFEQKRQRKAMMVLCLVVAWPLQGYQWTYLVFVLAAALYVFKQPYLRLKGMQRRLIGQLKYAFPLWLRQLQVLLQNHTVLQAMQLSAPNAPSILRPSIAQLVGQIQINPVSITPYLEFMQEYEIYEIQKAMKLLYRYHFVGAEESYQQFHRMIEATGKWLRQARKDKKANQMVVLQWLGMLPLFGVTFMFVVMMIVLVMEMMKGGIG